MLALLPIAAERETVALIQPEVQPQPRRLALVATRRGPSLSPAPHANGLAAVPEPAAVAPLAVITLDRDRNVTGWNAAVDTLLGWSPAEMVGRPFLLAVPPGARSECGSLLDAACTGDTARTIESLRHARDGSVVAANVTVTAQRDASGEVLGFVVVFAEPTVRGAFDERALGAQKMETLGRLATGIAHDFNNLISVVSNYATLLAGDMAAADPRQADLQQISSAAAQAAGLTRRLLTFCGHRVAPHETQSLNAIVVETEQMMRRLVSENIRFRLTLDPDLGGVDVDPVQIEQVLVNLMLNARDAMPDGGTILIETSNTAILPGRPAGPNRPALDPGAYVLLSVSDTGIGMSREVQARVFEPFFTTKDADSGTGLGLATAYDIVQQAHGHIWVQSVPGVGTRFHILLPRVG